MRKLTMTILALLLSVTLQATETYHVVPQPQDVQLQKGQPFVLDGTVQILAAENLQREAIFLRDYIKEQTGLELAITSRHNRKIRTIALTVSPSVVASEGYRLVVGKGGVNILGGSPAGVFYGIQTLRKSLGIADSLVSLELPPVVITDAPRFSWRGMHLDCARHFFSVAFVKKFIDLLAMHNMNIFHWHITDDQGWRVEIPKWPKLITIGSNRSGTIIGTNSDLDDQTPYGGYYGLCRRATHHRRARDRHARSYVGCSCQLSRTGLHGWPLSGRPLLGRL